MAKVLSISEAIRILDARLDLTSQLFQELYGEVSKNYTYYDSIAIWLLFSESQAIPIGYFVHPTGFLSACLQKYARKAEIAVDLLTWETSVLPVDEDGRLPSGSTDGVILSGIFLEGAR